MKSIKLHIDKIYIGQEEHFLRLSKFQSCAGYSYIVVNLNHVFEIFGLYTMAFPVVEFSREGYKIRKVFG